LMPFASDSPTASHRPRAQPRGLTRVPRVDDPALAFRDPGLTVAKLRDYVAPARNGVDDEPLPGRRRILSAYCEQRDRKAF
jgi:hypothetical protein